MKKQLWIIIASMLVLCGCTKTENGDVAEIFNRYTDKTFYNERTSDESDALLTGVSQEYTVVDLIRISSTNSISNTYFSGLFEDEEIQTFEYFDNEANILTNTFDVTSSYDDYERIGSTEFILSKRLIEEDEDRVSSIARVFWFTGDEESPTLNGNSLESMMDRESSDGYYNLDTVTQFFEDFDVDEAQPDIIYELIEELNDETVYTTFVDALRDAVIIPQTPGFGDTITFDNLEITLHSITDWAVIDNDLSDLDGTEVFFVDVTVRNLSAEIHGLNMFLYEIYGPDGTRLSSVSAFFDDTIDFAGDLLEGAEQTALLPIEYQGDGLYTIYFNNYSEEVTVEFIVVQ